MGNGGEFLTVRAFYRKQGRIKYISHLDMNRCISRALKRSGLPVWHTQGFNPHIYVTFALPLALGFEGLCETFDFRLIGDAFTLEDAAKRLNEVLPEGLEVYALQPAAQKPEEICRADYEITQEFDTRTPAEVLEKLREWMTQPEIRVMKRTKKGDVEIDIKPSFELLEANVDDAALHLNMRCAAGAQLNISPMLALDAFTAESGCAPDWTRVVRTAILDAQNNDFA